MLDKERKMRKNEKGIKHLCHSFSMVDNAYDPVRCLQAEFKFPKKSTNFQSRVDAKC